jgi:hypothetical protein
VNTASNGSKSLLLILLVSAWGGGARFGASSPFPSKDSVILLLIQLKVYYQQDTAFVVNDVDQIVVAVDEVNIAIVIVSPFRRPRLGELEGVAPEDDARTPAAFKVESMLASEAGAEALVGNVATLAPLALAGLRASVGFASLRALRLALATGLRVFGLRCAILITIVAPVLLGGVLLLLFLLLSFLIGLLLAFRFFLTLGFFLFLWFFLLRFVLIGLLSEGRGAQEKAHSGGADDKIQGYLRKI